MYTLYRSPAAFYKCLITVMIALCCTTATHQKFLYYPMLTYSGGTYRSGELFYSGVLFQVTLLRWLTYLLGSQTLILTVLLFWRYLFFLTLVFLKLGSGEFWGNASNILNKGKSAIPPLFNGQEVLPSASDESKLFVENFSENSDLDHLGISLHVFPSRTNLILHNISVTPRMVKKVITNLDMSKVVSATFVLVCFLSVNESTFQNRKTVFYFTSKALFVLEKIKF